MLPDLVRHESQTIGFRCIKDAQSFSGMIGGIMQVSGGSVKFDKISFVMANEDHGEKDIFWANNSLVAKVDVTKPSRCNEPWKFTLLLYVAFSLLVFRSELRYCLPGSAIYLLFDAFQIIHVNLFVLEA